MKAFSVCGISQSGKTTTVERIIGELKSRGYRVGTVKDIHFQEFAMDEDGTNTWRHRKAGAEIVIARGFWETDILIPRRLDLKSLLSFFDQDYVILEGVSEGNLPKIICAHQVEDAVERINDLVFAISGRIAENLQQLHGIPVINALREVEKLVDLIETKVTEPLPYLDEDGACRECGFSCRELAVRILRGESLRSGCTYSKKLNSKQIDESRGK